MTEKRYTHNILGSVFKDGKLFALTQGESQAITLCIELNSLNEENEQLKNEIEKIAYANENLLKEKRLWKKLSDEYAKLYEENEQLKTQLQNTSDQRDEFYRGARENANRLGKLEKENEQLVKMLNNAANYVQREHKEIPLDDFVEWWNNMVTEGLE